MNYTNYNFLVLDIETSKLLNDCGEPVSVWLSYGYCKLYNRDGLTLEKNYFRKWGELSKFLDRVSSLLPNRKIACYVHNLSYEFDFLIKNLSKPKEILTNSSHAVISCTLEDFPQICFRCSAKLSAMKLSQLGETLGFEKLESEYRTITPMDEVTEDEKIYCERDCDIVAKYVSEKLLKEFGTFQDIPFTKTGRVRKTYNKFYDEYRKQLNKNGQEVDWDLMPTEECYEAELNAFQGGITISNPMFTGLILKNVHSYDETSAYPYAQLNEDYPYTIRKEENPNISMLNDRLFIAKIKFNYIRSKFDWGWLSVSKMNAYEEIGSEYFNGKLMSAKWVIRTVTSIDYEMIKETYDFLSVELLEFYSVDKYGKMPEPYIKTIDLYAREKHELKEAVKNTPLSDEKWLDVNAEYMQAKSDFNSIYGMTVQKLVTNEYDIDELFVWRLKNKKYKYSEKHIKRNFLFGVFITAYARRNLLRAIIKNCPLTFVYADTDSIKFIGENKFEDTNTPLTCPFNEKDYLKDLGRFEYECTYEKFITYGAKKYAFVDCDIVYLTVAGLPKIKIETNSKMEIFVDKVKISLEEFRNDIKYFKLGTIFKNCKLGKKYLVGGCTFELDDDNNVVNLQKLDHYTEKYLKENKIKTGGGVALFDTSYKLNMTEHDLNYVINDRGYLKTWLNSYKIQNGIDLTNWIDLEQVIRL